MSATVTFTLRPEFATQLTQLKLVVEREEASGLTERGKEAAEFIRSLQIGENTGTPEMVETFAVAVGRADRLAKQIMGPYYPKAQEEIVKNFIEDIAKASWKAYSHSQKLHLVASTDSVIPRPTVVRTFIENYGVEKEELDGLFAEIEQADRTLDEVLKEIGPITGEMEA